MLNSYVLAVVFGTIIMCSLASQAGAVPPAEKDGSMYYVYGKRDTKVGALRALILEPGSEVVRCIPQELSEKATLRNVKKNK